MHACTRVNLAIYTPDAAKKKKQKGKKERGVEVQRRATGGSAFYAGGDAFIDADNAVSLYLYSLSLSRILRL